MTKISELPTGTPSDSDIVVLNDGSVTSKATLSALKAYLGAGLDIVKAACTDTSTNFNQTSFTPVTCDTAVFSEGNVISHSTSTNNSRFSVNADGYYRVTFNVRLNSSTARVAPQFGIRKNGSTLFNYDVASHTYIRATSSHNYSTANLHAIISLTSGDYIELGNTQQDGSSGTTTMTGNTSVTVEKI